MMRPNQTRLRVYSAVLRLESFTVAQLCLLSGLTPDMVYRELASLQKRDILIPTSTRSDGEAAPRHRPPQRYRIVDGAHRQALRNEMLSFLPEEPEEAVPSRHLIKAQESLTAVDHELTTVSLSKLGARLEGWEKGLSSRLEDVQSDLQRASWESEKDFSEAENSGHPVVLAQKLYERLNAQFQTLVRAEHDRRARERFWKSWGTVLGDITKEVVPAGAGASFAGLTAVLEPSGILKIIDNALAKRQAVEINQDDKLGSLISSLKLGLLDAQSVDDLLRNLAKQTIEYAISVDEPLAISRKMAALTDDYRLNFNEANLEFIASDHKRAFDCWNKYLEHRVHNKGGASTLVFRILKERWSSQAYQDIVRSLTNRCHAAAVSAFSQSPFDADNDYLKPKLYNPIHDRDENQSVFIPMSEPLAKARGLYVLTTQAEQLTLPGVAPLICANLLAFSLPAEEAWKVATKLKPTECVLKVDFLGSADSPARDEAEQLLKSSFAAEILA